MGEGRLINVRKLAALDLYFRRPGLILFEFGFAVFGFGALGTVAILLRKSPAEAATGMYLLFLAIDYVPLLIYGLRVRRRQAVQKELANELADLERAKMKYGVQQMLLLVPFFIPILSLSQELRGKDRNRAAEGSA